MKKMKYCKLFDDKIIMKQLENNEKMIYIELTNRCNMHCIHCFNNSGDSDEELTDVEISEIFNALSNINVKQVLLSGGEIYTYKNINKVIELFASKYPVKILTNGKNISYDDIKTILKNNVEVQITLNGHNAELDKKIRGEGFDDTVNSIKKIIEYGGRDLLIVTTTINGINMKNIEDIIIKCIEYGVKKIQFTFIYDMGRAVQNWDKLKLTMIDKIEVLKKLAELNNKYNNKIDIKTSGMKQFFQFIKPFDYEFSCDKLTEEISVRTNSKSMSCPKLETYLDCTGIKLLNWHETLSLYSEIEYVNKTECSDCIAYRSCIISCIKEN